MSKASAVIYVRQSMDVAEGIQRQLARCRTLAEARGWTVVEEFEDNAVSATKARGPQSAWSRLLASEVELVIAVDLDRLVRSQRDLLALLESGKRVVTVDGEIDLSSADGEFRATMMAALARFEVRRKGERSVRSNQDRVARRGLPVAGKRRFGFKPGNIQAEPEEAAQVEKAYLDILAGHSLRSIAQSWGRPPVRVREILTNPSYAGWVTREGVKYEAAPEVARIVDRDIWQAVQDLLSDEKRRVSPGPQRKHVLSGIAKCGECGAAMSAVSRYYKCSADTSHATIYKQPLEDHAFRWLFVALGEDEAEEFGAPAPLAARLRELEEERTRWTRVAALPGADLAAIEAELAALSLEVQKVSDELGKARVSGAYADLAESARQTVREMVEEGGGTYELDFTEWIEYVRNLDLDAQRALVGRLSIQVFKGRGLERVKISD